MFSVFISDQTLPKNGSNMKTSEPNSTHTPNGDKDLAAIYKRKGDAFLELEKYDDALSCYAEAIELKPDFVEAWRATFRALLMVWAKEKPEEFYKLGRELGVIT